MLTSLGLALACVLGVRAAWRWATAVDSPKGQPGYLPDGARYDDRE